MSTQQFDSIMKKASLTAKEYTTMIRQGTGSAKTYAQSQMATNVALQSVGTGAKIASVGVTTLKNIMNTVWVFAIINAVLAFTQVISSLVDHIVNANEIAIEKADEILNKFNSDIDELDSKKSTLEGLESEFNKLSKGVDDYGKNVSLTADEYERYQDIVETIVGVNPSLISGWDEEGNILARKNGLLEDSIQLLKDEYQQKIKNMALPDNIGTAIDGAVGRYNTSKEKFHNVTIPNSLAYSGVKIDADGNEEYGYVNQISEYIEDVIGVEFKNEGIDNYILNNAEAVFNNLDKIKERAAETKDGWKGLTDSQIIDLMDYFRELRLVYNDMNTAATSANSTLQYVAMAEDSYAGLTDKQKVFISDYINGIKITAETTEQEKDAIRKSIVSITNELANHPDTSQLFEDLYTLPKDELPADEYIAKYKQLVEDIIKALDGEDGTGLSEEQEIEIKARFNIVDDENSINTMKEELKDKVQGDLGILSLEDLKIAYEKIDFGSGIISLEELIAKIEEYKKSLQNSNKMTVSLAKLEKVSDNIKPLGTAFKELSDDGYITIKTLKEVKDAADLSSEEWDDYEAKLLKAKAGSTEFNQIMSELTYKILDNTFAGKDQNAVTEQQVAAILRENGVINADAVAHEWLTNAKIKNKIATFDFANATEDELDIFYKELKVLGLTETAVGSLSKAYAEAQAAMLKAASTGALNRLKISQDELKGIKSVADAYKLMAGKGYDVNNDGVEDYFGSEKDRSHFDKYRDQYNEDVESVLVIAKAQEEIQKIIDGIDTKGTVPNYSGASKDSSSQSDKNEALDNYLKDAENRYKIHQDETKYIQELQYAYDNLTQNEKERLDITGKINEAYRDLADNRIKDIEHQIDLVKELHGEDADVTGYYDQIQKVAHEEANRLRAMGYDDNSDEIQDLQKTWWDAQNSIADESYSNSERWINERNTYNDWELYGDNEIAAWERVIKWLKEEYPDELGKIEEAEQNYFEARKAEMEESISDIDDYINARNHYNDWDAYGDSELKAIRRQTEIIKKAYEERLLSSDEYVKRLEENSQRIYSLVQDEVDKQLSNIDKYIDARNHYNDWDAFGDSEIEAIKRQCAILDEALRLNLISLETYTEKSAEYTQRLYSVAKDNIIETVSELVEDYEEMKQFESSQLESQKTLLQAHYNVTNAIADAQREINKELRASQSMHEYLDEDTRELLFNQEDYNALNEELLDIQSAAHALQEQYNEDILNASEETIAEITEQYQMQYETLMKQYEIAKAELEVAKKRQKLDNVLAERNVRMFINGQWQWVANTQDVIDAQNELADAEVEKEKLEASLEQTEAINRLTENINSIETDLNKARKYLEDMQELLNGESDEVARALRQISKVSSPTLKKIIKTTGGDIGSFSTFLSNSTTTMSGIIDTNLGNMSIGIDNIVIDLQSYSDAIRAMVEEIENSGGSPKGGSSSGSSSKGSSGGSESYTDATATIPGIGLVGVKINSSGRTVTTGLPVGTIVHTAGGDYRITGGTGGNYTSEKVKKKYADGTRYTSGGLTLMGEEGFEAFVSNTGRLIPIDRPTIGNVGAGGIVFNREQMANLRNLWDWSSIGKMSHFVSSSNTNKHETIIDNSIHINGLTVGEQGNEDWINGLRRYVATHK